MFCTGCGKGLPEAAVFCPHCGAEIARAGADPGVSVGAGVTMGGREAPRAPSPLDAGVFVTQGGGATVAPAIARDGLGQEALHAGRGVYRRQVVVSAAGDGDHRTIGEALAHVEADTRIAVRPGHYVEGLVIAKPVEIVGDGPVEQILIEGVNEHGVLMWAERALLQGLTLRTSCAGATDRFGVNVAQGRLELRDCDIAAEGLVCMAVHGAGVEASLLSCTIHDSASGVFVYEGGTVSLYDCRVCANALAGIAVSAGGHVALTRCTIEKGQSSGIHFQGGGGEIENCELMGQRAPAIVIGAGSAPVIRRCSLHDGAAQGILVSEGGAGAIEDCQVFGHASSGIEIRDGADPVVRGCTIRDGQHTGLYVFEHGKGTIEDCEITGNKLAGVVVRSGGCPVVRRCKIHHGQASGVYVFGQGRGLFERCDIFSNALEGIRVCEHGDPEVRGCTIHHGAANGVLVYKSGGGVFEDCHISENAQAGVAVRESGHPAIRRCIIRRNRHEAIRLYESASAIVEGCDLIGNERGAWNMAPACEVRRANNLEGC